MPSPIIGPPVQGRDFFGREADISAVLAALDSGHVLLLAPRRVGKTSLLYRLRDTAGDRNDRAVSVTVSSARDEEDVVQRLLQAIIAIDGTVEGRVRERCPATTATRWDHLGAALAEALDRTGPRWLLLIDELPVFVSHLLSDHGVHRTRRFLDWLRELRQTWSQTRWVLAGSIGLDTVAELHHLTSTINDLRLLHLGAFSEDVAHAYLVAVGEEIDLPMDEPVRRHLLERIGWPIPYFLNLLLVGLQDLAKKGIAPSPQAVDQAYERLVAREHAAYFGHWRQRLYEQLDHGRARHAHALLDAVAKDPHGASHDVLTLVHPSRHDRADGELRFLLNLLHSDGYVVEFDGRFRFRSPLLRDHWRLHALLEHTP